MAKEKVIKQMTDEQRQKNLSTPGVVVHRRTQPIPKPFYVPKLRVYPQNSLTASDLIDGEDEDRRDHD